MRAVRYAKVTKPIFRAAIIGAGFIADYHVNGLRAAGAVVTALVGRNLQRTAARARQLGIARAETEVASVLNDREIDGIVVATPDSTHRQIAMEALEAEKAVMIQKPMAMTSDDCRALIEAASKAPHRLSVSFMHRHFPEVRWLRKLLDRGVLGPVHMLRIRNATPGADWADWFYRKDAVAGGVVMQLGVHGIDLVQHLFGPIDRVGAQCRTALPERVLSDGSRVTTFLEDNAAATYRLAAGALVSHEMSCTEIAGCDRFRLELYTEKGTVWLRTERGAAALFASAVNGVKDWVGVPVESEPPGRDHHASWIAAASGSGDDTARAGLSTMLVAEAIYRSHATAAVQTVGEAA